MQASHVPVLTTEIIEILSPGSGETVLDVTVGLGGHAEGFLLRIGERGCLIGLDADSENLSIASAHLSRFGPRVSLLHAHFQDIAALELQRPDILFADLGMSAPHVDDPSRGFTFRRDVPLDLRYDRTRGERASIFLSRLREEEIAEMLAAYGEVRGAKRIARVLWERMHPRHAHHEPIATTGQLRSVIESTCGYRAPWILPQVFQALRIAVNDELGALQALLTAGPGLLAPGGRMGIISYHSLEDRMVKHMCRERTAPIRDPHTGAVTAPASFELLTRKPVKPSPGEVSRNPRSRSALFRAIRRCV